MKRSYFSLQGRFDRWQYLAGLIVAGLVWLVVYLIFEGPAKEQFVEKPVIPQAIATVPALLVFLFVVIKRFRDVNADWWIRLLYLAGVIGAATADMLLPDFNLRFPFYERVLNSLWLTGLVLLLIWPPAQGKTEVVKSDDISEQKN